MSLTLRETRSSSAAMASGALPADLLVIGGGMAGLTAGTRAARGGAKVVLVERAPELGGSAVFASNCWTTPTFEALWAVDSDGDPELGRALVEGFADGVEWIRSVVGVDVGPSKQILR
jgi:NADPH-dependent 2,4-dienoyl-CoA reductase/sulfur reductase-like enzyme